MNAIYSPKTGRSLAVEILLKTLVVTISGTLYGAILAYAILGMAGAL